MSLIKEYKLKEKLKKQIFLEIEENDLPPRIIIEMLEELINLYK
jgi:hypothetical protein